MKSCVSAGLWLLAAGFVLMPGCAQFERAGSMTRKTFEVFAGDTALKAARAMENDRLPDARRKGINKLVEREYGRRDPYTARYAQIARNDEDFLVRATAVRALNRARHRPATPVFVDALKDEHAQVRLEAAKALANVPDANAVAPLVGIVNNAGEDRDVRIAAADALQHYKQLEVAQALARQLGEKGDFSVAWQARRSLTALTGRDLRYDQSAWLAFLTGSNAPFG